MQRVKGSGCAGERALLYSAPSKSGTIRQGISPCYVTSAVNRLNCTLQHQLHLSTPVAAILCRVWLAASRSPCLMRRASRPVWMRADSCWLCCNGGTSCWEKLVLASASGVAADGWRW